MHIAYCTNVRLPSERAHGHQVARVCDAFVKLGQTVEIIAPRRCDNPVQEDFWTFHGVDRRVSLTHTSSFDGIACRLTPGPLGLWMTTWSYLHYARHRILAGNFDLLYSRTPEILPMLLATKIPVVLELHKLPRYGRTLFVRRCRRCALIVCLTTPMRDELVTWGVSKGKIIVDGDAVDLKKFSDLPPKEKARKELGVRDLQKFTVGYAGSFKTMGLDKGVTTIIHAVNILRSQGRSIAKIIVGQHMDLDEFEKIRNEDLQPGTNLGFLSQKKMQLFYSSCDLFIYPAPRTSHPYFMRDTSPLKIFEYMAAGKPIVTADLPPIRDILDESTAFFCKPGDPEDLARAIAYALDHPDEAQAKAKKALERVQEYTWEKRMGRIMKALEMAPGKMRSGGS